MEEGWLVEHQYFDPQMIPISKYNLLNLFMLQEPKDISIKKENSRFKIINS